MVRKSAYYKIIAADNFLILLLFFGLPFGFSQSKQRAPMEHHVAVDGNDRNDGSFSKPFKTIMAAAKKALPGDTITVHEGIYREQVSPPRGGRSEKERIWYRAARGEEAELKGSEIIKKWERVNNSDFLWTVKIRNAFFGKFNPYRDTLRGVRLRDGGWRHTGEVYLNGKPLTEVKNRESADSAGLQAYWYCETDEKHTRIWAAFLAFDPNEETVEINVRQSVFYPSRPGIDYIQVTGFVMSQAPTPRASPAAEPIGLLGAHRSKGWAIENNVFKQSKCAGVTLGNGSAASEAYVKTKTRASKAAWNKNPTGNHLVRNNEIYDCGQVGIIGGPGVLSCKIEHNDIHDIGKQKLFWNYENAGIRIHGAAEVEISGNHIYRTGGGICLDRAAQGTRITKNILHDNQAQDLSLEANHGLVLIDNNLFLSPQSAQVRLSRGLALVHNFIAWKIIVRKLWEAVDADERETPFPQPYAAAPSDFHNTLCGDARFYNNIFLGTDLSPYDYSSLPVEMEGNVFLADAKPSARELHPILDPRYNSTLEITEKKREVYLSIYLEKMQPQEQPLKFITSQELGMGALPPLEEEGAHVFDLSADYLGKERDKNEPCAGPFEISNDGRQEIKVWSVNSINYEL